MIKNITGFLITLYFTLYLNSSATSQSLPTIGIYPLDAEGVSQIIVQTFRDDLESKLLASRKFTVVTRDRIDEIIKEQEFQITCSAEECAIELGKILGADIIVGKLSGLGRNNYHINVKMLKTETGEIAASFSEYHEAEITEILKLYPGKVADSIIEQLSSGLLELFGSPDKALVKLNDEIIGRLPITNHRVKPGVHTIIVEQYGYVKWKNQYLFTQGEKYTPYVELTPKTKKSAFVKSLIIPGWGQLYSSDDRRFGKKILGYSFLVAETALIAGSYFIYNDYLDKKTRYDKAHTDYYNENGSSAAIASKREIMLDKYRSMEDAFDLFKILSFTAAGLWIGNALEAYLNFPEYADINLGYYNRDHWSFAENSKRGVRVEVSVAF